MKLTHLNNHPVKESVLKDFGTTVGSVFLIAGLYFVLNLKPFGLEAITIGTILTASGSFLPTTLLFIYKAWMTLAEVMNFFMTKFLLLAVYILAILPIGLIRSAIETKKITHNLGSNSYWKPRKRLSRKQTILSYQKQF